MATTTLWQEGVGSVVEAAQRESGPTLRDHVRVAGFAPYELDVALQEAAL